MEGWLCETIDTTQQGLETPTIQQYKSIYHTGSFQFLLCSIYGETEANSYSTVVQMLRIGIPLNRWSVWISSDVRVRAGTIM